MNSGASIEYRLSSHAPLADQRQRRPGIAAVAVTLLAAILSAGPLAAQNGDKPGVPQVARVPRDRIPPSPPLPPDAALKAFRTAPGVRVELAASEPLIEAPILIQFDPRGRMWVIEMRSYMPNPDGAGEAAPASRISILEDTDHDGRMDRRTVFLDGLVLPRALLLVYNGALVCEPPRLWFYPVDGDRPGARVLVAEDFAKEADPALGSKMNPEHSGSSLILGLDNWIYCLNHPFRYRRTSDRWIREPNPQRSQWGLSQDDFGRLFFTSNSDHLRGDLIPSHYFGSSPSKSPAPGINLRIAADQSVWPARVNPGVNRGYEPGTLREDGTLARFTAASGTCVYRGDLFPPEFYGNAFVGEPSGNLVRRSTLAETNGVITARNACEKSEFLSSTDELFRPVNLAAGPDGALYIADMYRGIIQHRVYLTSYLRAQAEDRGLQRVTNHGRIWRVVPDVKTSSRPAPALDRAATPELVESLAHPNGWHRETAQRLLVDRHDPQSITPLENLARTSTNPLARLHALWTLDGQSKASPGIISSALADPHPKVRAAAVRLAESHVKGAPTNAPLLASLITLEKDPSADVRIQLALTLAQVDPSPAAGAALAALAQSPPGLARDTARFVEARRAAATNAPASASASPPRTGRPLTPEEQKRLEDGRTMYEATCLACHQQHGNGQPGLAPPLVESEWVAGSPARLIRIVLHGLRGPIKVKGETYEMDMPALGVLDDDQIASALTYVRRAWGHTFDPVDPAQVKKVRDETASREDAWTMADLLKVP